MVALEFLSRDCGSVTSVESDPKAVRGMSDASPGLGTLTIGRWFRGNALQFIERSLTQYDLIFCRSAVWTCRNCRNCQRGFLSGPLLVPGGWFYLGARRAKPMFSGCAHYVENPEVRSTSILVCSRLENTRSDETSSIPRVFLTPSHAAHLNILERSVSLFDEVIVAVGMNSAKRSMFSLEQTLGLARVGVRTVFPMCGSASFEGLTADFLPSQRCAMAPAWSAQRRGF